MKRKRVRFCIKWFDGKLIEIISIRPHRDGLVMWTPGSKRHIMTIKEVEAISSHITDQETNEHIPLGRLIFEELDVDQRMAELGKIRKLDSSEYDQLLYYKNSEFWDLLMTYDFEMVTEEREKEIIKFMDLPRLYEGIDERMAELQDKRPQPFLKCRARDLLDRTDIEAGITEDQLAVFEYDGELWEMDPLHLYDFGSKEHPWAELLKPLGVFELLREINLEKKLSEV
jgi:hypothetical protein